MSRREEVDVEPGREVVAGCSGRVVAFQVALEVRLHHESAMGELLRIRLQRDQLDAVADDMGDPPAVRANRAGRGAGGIGSPFTSWPVRASHTFAVWSALPVMIRVPSALNATLRFCVLAAIRVPIRVPSGLNEHARHVARVPFQFEQAVPVRAVPYLRRLVMRCR